MLYTVIIEKGETSFGAYVPDLPGCVAVGETPEEVSALIREAIEFHKVSHRHPAEHGSKRRQSAMRHYLRCDA